MGIFFSWINANWFDLLQTAGIVAGLLFPAFTARRESKSRNISNLLAITQSHREIWLQVFENQQLLRILKPKINLERHPVSLHERIFVNLIILHLTSVLAAVREGVMDKPEGHDKDIVEFFSLPIPKSVLESTSDFRDPETRNYLATLLPGGKKTERRINQSTKK